MKPAPRSAFLTIRCAPEERAAWLAAARAAGLTLSEIIRAHLSAMARAQGRK